MVWRMRLNSRLDIKTVAGRLRAALWAGAAGMVALQAAAQSLDLTDLLDDQIDQQIQDELVETLEESIQEQIQSDVAQAVEQQVEAGVAGGIEKLVEGGVGQTVDDVLKSAGELIENVGDAADGDAPREQFFAGIDDLGRTVERDVWVILVPNEHAARIEAWGFNIRERRDLAALDRVLLRVDAPEDRDIVQAALDLALDAPGTLVDFNHVYDDADGAPDQSADAPVIDGVPVSAVEPRPALRVGMVDSAVAAAHEALRQADIVQQDFVPFEGARPTAHGTAVASILVAESRASGKRLDELRVHAASVFFADANGNAAATTASLVAALEWLTAADVGVINMSLTGPPNRVLEATLSIVAAHGAIVVAAVGNNGPLGEPLYPAAYDSVVGVTAVDSHQRIYRYASRGQQVGFSAPGVRIRVARSDGGYGAESGTSMAAPHAAAVIAWSRAARGPEPAETVLATLEAAAIDLGDENFDPVFGFGLITAVK